MTRRGPVHQEGPSPSERVLFQIWDAIDWARYRQGEQAAHELAVKALAAVQAPVEPPRPPRNKEVL